MPADTALSRLARDIVTVAAALLAIVTPLTHLAQSTGLSFHAYSITVALAAVVVAVWCVARSRTGAREMPGWRDGLPLLVLCALAAVVPIVVQHATADDAVYLPSVVHSIAHPADAMSFEVRYAWFGERVVESPHWNVATAFDYLEGVLAYLTGIPLLTVRYLVAPALIASLLPLAFVYLLTRFGFGDTPALAGCLLLGAALLLMRETEQAPGAVALLRTYQGKFVALAIGMPFFTALLLDLARAHGRTPWKGLLATATAIAGCGSSAVLLLGLLAPLLVLSAVIAFPRGRAVARRTMLLAAAAMAYPCLVAVWALVKSGASLGSDSPVHGLYAHTFGPNAAWVFPGLPTNLLMVAATVLALPALASAERRFVLLWGLGAGVLLLNPLVAPLVIDHLTTPNLYWRAFYVAPLLPLVALAGAAVADRLLRHAPGRARWVLGAVVGALLLLQIPAQLSGRYDRSQLVHPFPDPDRCLNRIVAAQARFLARVAPAGPMLAPPYLSRIVPLVGAGHPQLMHQEESILLWAADEARLRFAASDFLAGGVAGDVASVSELLLLHPEVVAVAAFPEALARPGLEEALGDRGFEPVEEAGPGVVLFVRRP